MSSVRLLLLALSVTAAISPARAININQFNVAVTENFDSLANTGTSSTLPPGWAFNETGTSNDGLYTAGAGTSTTGDTYSFGTGTSTDRALGSVRTGTLVSAFGAQFTNATGGIITDLAILYTGEQWRMGASGREDRLDFAISLNASSLTTGTWTDVNALDFIAPINTGSARSLDGNAAANQSLISHTITGLNLAPGASLWLRWSDFDATGADDGLAIDNFSLTAVQQPAQGVPDHLPLASFAFVAIGVLCTRSAMRRQA
jgi:hypothetical protein